MSMKHYTGIKPRVYPVTKKQLCVALGLYSRKGKMYYDKLRRDYLTDDLLKRAGIQPEEYHKKSIFPLSVTKIILAELDIEPEEILQPL